MKIKTDMAWINSFIYFVQDNIIFLYELFCMFIKTIDIRNPVNFNSNYSKMVCKIGNNLC